MLTPPSVSRPLPAFAHEPVEPFLSAITPSNESTPVELCTPMALPALPLTEIVFDEAIDALVSGPAVPAPDVETVPDVIRPPSRTIEVPAPRAPSPLKTTSPPVTVNGPVNVLAEFATTETPVPLNVTPTPELPEITPSSWRYPPALFVIVRVALPSEMPTLEAATALLPLPSIAKVPPIVTLEAL